MIVCPECGGASVVKDKRGNRRRRVCEACGARWNTVEVIDERTPRISSPSSKSRQRRDRRVHLPKGQYLAKVRGCIVPPELEDDWKFLKKKGFTNAEAARSLNLKFKLPTKRP